MTERINLYYTTKEIWQQPRLWLETLALVKGNQGKIREFLGQVINQKKARIVLTGAGSSAFVGDCVAPYLNKIVGCQVEAVATTDIVSNPYNYLHPDCPTLLISFARSGNSPESLATVQLADQFIPDVYHLALTCNPDGSLARNLKERSNSLVLLMPEDSNDKGFAMTGSFSTMMLATLLLFNLDSLDELAREVKLAADLGSKLLESQVDGIRGLGERGFKRAVYLGSSSLRGVAQEGALKMLELTAGKVVSMGESMLGFRHGPKSVVDKDTLVLFFMSQDNYTRQYELDLLREMAEDNLATLVVLSPQHDSEVDKLAHYSVSIGNKIFSDDVFLAFPYVIYAQVLALLTSIALGIDPDNPSPDGLVNRIVQGVTIYPYTKLEMK